MSRHPFPWTRGGPRSLRASLYKKLTALLRSFYPLGTEHPSLPPDLGAAEAWALRGDDTLNPAP